MPVCLYVCMYKYTYHAQSNVCKYTYIWLRMIYIYVCICMSIYVCICMSIYVCICMYMYVCICMYMYVCIYMYIYTYRHTNMYICIYIGISAPNWRTCIYMYMCIYIYTLGGFFRCLSAYLVYSICIYTNTWQCVCVCICTHNTWLHVHAYIYL